MTGFNLGCEKALTIWLGFEIWGIWVDVFVDLGKKKRVQKNQVENVAKGKEEGSGGYGFRKAVAADWGWFSTTISS